MKKLTKQKANNQKGFTLIELVVVIVILGILAVTAAPKFINLQDDARTATLQAIKASMQSAGTLINSKALIAGNEGTSSGKDVFVYVNSKRTQINYGYPLANYTTAITTDNKGNWDDLLDLNSAEFTTAVVGDSFTVRPFGKTLPKSIPVDPYTPTSDSNCFAFYTQAANADTPPNIQVVECL